MEVTVHNITTLFAQLGEASDEASISRFIETHGPMPEALRLHEAPFWSASQARFLCEALAQDADWSDAADELNIRLHHVH